MFRINFAFHDPFQPFILSDFTKLHSSKRRRFGLGNDDLRYAGMGHQRNK